MSHAFYMERCIQLALKGGIYTKSNPPVGAVIVHRDRIIGEGWHALYGGPHAEVNAIHNVAPEDRQYLAESTLYVSLEPCCVQGKTPACTGLILANDIKNVIIGSVDPDPRMCGKGIQMLQGNGVQVEAGILQEQCDDLIKRFSVNLHKMPYLMLKWACSFDQIMGIKNENLAITDEKAQYYTHKWRSEFHGIMVGKGTVLADDPQLNNRLYPGPSPIKIIMDANLEVPLSSRLIRDGQILVINEKIEKKEGNIQFVMAKSTHDWNEVLPLLYQLGIFSVMVEGGPTLLNSLITGNYWHEARVLRTTTNLKSQLSGKEVIMAPEIKGKLQNTVHTGGNTTAFFISAQNNI